MARYGYVKTEEALLNWIRSALRKTWSKHPSKLGLLERKRVKKPSSTGRMLYQVDCSRCGKYFKLADVEVNHKVQVGKNFCVESLGDFTSKLLMVSEDDLEILCKPCHAVVTYMERSGMSMEDAEIEKKVINFMKKPAAEQKAAILSVGILPASTAPERRNQVRQIIKERIKK